MKKNILYTLSAVAVMLFVTDAAAQNTVKQGNVTIQANKLEQRGDSLYIDILFDMYGKNVSSRKSADFTPVLISPSQKKFLPMISIKGRNDYANYRRSMALMNQTTKSVYADNSPYEVVKGYKKGKKTIKYKLAIPYEKWMSKARLDLIKDDCGCGKSQATDMKTLVNQVNMEYVLIPNRYEITPSLAYIKPEVEIEKRRVEKGESKLDFVVSGTKIDPAFGRNPHELEIIRKMIELVFDDKDIDIKGIAITGYASPEGSLANNKRLSEARALSLENYLLQKYPSLDKKLYQVYFGGENWGDLLAAVKVSNMQYKQEVIDILEGNDAEREREVKIMQLHGGAPYKYMLKEMFPALRKVTISVDYRVNNFDVDKAKEVVKSRPQNLSLNEMFAVAHTYEKGSQEFNDLFETAVRMFPEDQTANLNAAVSAIGRKDYVSAERYLKNVRAKIRIPEYDNAMGLLTMMRDNDFDKATEYFKSAEQAGLEAATANLSQIDKARENIEQIKKAEAKTAKYRE